MFRKRKVIQLEMADSCDASLDPCVSHQARSSLSRLKVRRGKLIRIIKLYHQERCKTFAFLFSNEFENRFCHLRLHLFSIAKKPSEIIFLSLLSVLEMSQGIIWHGPFGMVHHHPNLHLQHYLRKPNHFQWKASTQCTDHFGILK